MDKIVYNGFIQVAHREVNNRTYDVVLSKPAVAICLFNEAHDRILLVKQYRPAIEKTIWEIPAGMMDIDGESPVSCMLRELKEEADVETTTVSEMLSYYPLVGCSDHLLHLYCGTAKQTYNSKIMNDADVTEAQWFSKQGIITMINNGDIIDGKTILAFYLSLSQNF